jgi:Flp pilus assembly pilin Flp
MACFLRSPYALEKSSQKDLPLAESFSLTFGSFIIFYPRTPGLGLAMPACAGDRIWYCVYIYGDAMNTLTKLLREEQGMETVEWAIMAALIVAGVAVVVATIGIQIDTQFNNLKNDT